MLNLSRPASLFLLVSSRRGEEDDTSGHYLRDSAQEAGYEVVAKAIVKV